MNDHSFLQIYSNGGFFMHLTTIIAIAALVYTLKGIAILKWGPKHHGHELFSITMLFATRLVGLGIQGKRI